MTGQQFLKTHTLSSGILHISLNRPESRNALSKGLLEELHAVLMLAKTDAAIHAVWITGEGKSFCAGADIKELAQLNAQKGLEFACYGQQVFAALEELGKPSLAAIQGFALGGGCELAMAATFRILSEEAFLGQPEIKLGVIPGFGGTQRLSRLVGKGKALELCLTGRRVLAEEAVHIGLVNEKVPLDKLFSRSEEFLNQLLQYSPLALHHILTVIYHGYDLPLEEALRLEAAHFGICCGTKDKSEGVQAFLEKRTAVFSGE